MDMNLSEKNRRRAKEKWMGWMKEGLDSGNKSLCLMMCNEMEGLYRNTGRVAQAVDMADMALSLIAGMGLDGSIHHGTTLLNAATAPPCQLPGCCQRRTKVSRLHALRGRIKGQSFL